MPEIHDFKKYMEGDNPVMYHIHCRKGDVGEYVFLPGDPFRTDLIASYLDGYDRMPELPACNLQAPVGSEETIQYELGREETPENRGSSSW